MMYKVNGSSLSWIKYFEKPVGLEKDSHGTWLLRVDYCFLTNYQVCLFFFLAKWGANMKIRVGYL